MGVIPDSLSELFKAASTAIELSLPALKECSLGIAFEDDETNIQTVYNGKEPILPFARSPVFQSKIKFWRRLSAKSNECKAVYEMTFDVKDSNFEFKAGDTISVIPQNKSSEVNTVLSHLGLQSKADCAYTLVTNGSTKIPLHVPVKDTLRHMLTHCVDLRCVIKKLFLLALSKFTKSEDEKLMLEYLSSKQGSSFYNNHILNKKICVLDLFSMFKTCKPPIEILLANLSRLLPRPYSIVNSGLKEPDIIKICFSVMPIGNNRKGLTSGWLEEKILRDMSLDEQMMQLNMNESGNNKIPIYLRNNLSGFSLPQSIEAPIILVGPGTGVAPFIGFLEEREVLSRDSTSKGDVWLLSGCRNPCLDYLYEEELKHFKSIGVLTKLSTAFSRVDGHTEKYVQDSIQANGEDIVNLIQKGAFIFVCGDLKTMATQVREVFIKCLSEYQKISKEDAENIIKLMENKKKYVVDVWS